MEGMPIITQGIGIYFYVLKNEAVPKLQFLEQLP
jgi:hypothetical protein